MQLVVTCDSLELVTVCQESKICHVTLIFLIVEYLVIWVEWMLEYVGIVVPASHK